MMGDAVAQIADPDQLIITFGSQRLNGPAPIRIREDGSEMPVPDCAVVTACQHLLPEDELQLRDNLARRREVPQPDKVSPWTVAGGRVFQTELEATLPRPVRAICLLDRRDN